MLSVFFAVFVTTVAAFPQQIVQRGVPPHVSGGLPVAGEVWGPVITHAGKMRNTKRGLAHKYAYSTPRKEDVLVDYILPSEIFQNEDEMYAHVQSVVKDEDVVIQSNPAVLEGKYLEILTTKTLPSDKVKITCHSYKTKPAFCHRINDDHKGTQHKAKMMYSMVKETSSGKTFPCVFFSHQGCTEKNNEDSCYWVTHINEVVIIHKYFI
ncbi:Hypothetical predicted protein [Paramuricea clavata]|nr:Hypothetical predicted protein [Paramuricea clavata]